MRKRKRKNNNNHTFIFILIILALTAGFYFKWIEIPTDKDPATEHSVVKLVFPSDRYPETAHHIQEAIASKQSPICTIDRSGAEENRQLSLQNVPTKKSYDRDEWPMAMCEEGGAGADIAYITPADNRGAGSWVGNQLEAYPDGTRIEFIVP
ncbi:MAG: DNA-entry nuclease [Gorillibacterium sp.]|nr:DNA-entry nuclease [Gorillibacterium sp.]